MTVKQFTNRNAEADLFHFSLTVFDGFITATDYVRLCSVLFKQQEICLTLQGSTIIRCYE